MTNNLETQALAQFDDMVQKGQLFWTPTEEIKVEQHPFDQYFRISPITSTKPYEPNSKRVAFQDDDPAFTLCTIGDTHKLILNKYCWVRPQLILHTLEFQPQDELLTQADFDASWEVLERMGDRYMVVFNGGPDSGSSIAHRHLQVFPRPEWRTIADRIVDGEFDTTKIPFIYKQTNLSTTTTSTDLHTHYQSICSLLTIHNKTAHSLLLTKCWLVVIPRRCAYISGEIPNAPIQGGSNAMIGMQFLKNDRQFENWMRFGPMRVLEAFGVVEEGGKDEKGSVRRE